MSGLPQLPPQAPRALPNRPAGANFNAPNSSNFNNPSSGFDTGAAYNQTTGFSEHQKIQRSVAKSKKNAQVIQAVKLSRSQLESWLAQFGLKLLTSSVELQLTQNFIESSYVIYPNGQQIKLVNFLSQVSPDIQQLAQQITSQVRTPASHLDLVPPNQNPYLQGPGLDINPFLPNTVPALSPAPINPPNQNFQNQNFQNNSYQNPYQNSPNTTPIPQTQQPVYSPQAQGLYPSQPSQPYPTTRT